MKTPDDDMMARYLADYRRESVQAEQLVRVRARLEGELGAAGSAAGHGVSSSARALWLVGALGVGGVVAWMLLPPAPATSGEANAVARAEVARGDDHDRDVAQEPASHEARPPIAAPVGQTEAPVEALDATTVVEEPSQREPSKPRTPRVRASSADTDEPDEPDAPDAGSALARQLEIVKQARRELSLGRPHAALETLEGYARDFPERVFEAERLLLTAIAQCDAGVGADARLAIEELERRFPGHALLARARRVCRTSDERQSSSAATKDGGR